MSRESSKQCSKIMILSTFALACIPLIWRDLDLSGFAWAHSYHPCHIKSSLYPKKPRGLSEYVILNYIF